MERELGLEHDVSALPDDVYSVTICHLFTRSLHFMCK